MPNNDKHIIRFAAGTGRNFGKAVNHTKAWKAFSEEFKKPLVTPERVRDYLRMSEDEQKNLKAVAGWIYRTQVDGPVRNRGSGLPSDLITFDFDYATPAYLDAIVSGSICPEWEWFIHTSRRHTTEKPRFRMFVPVAQPISNDIYGAVSRIIAEKFDPEMKHVDKVSFRPAQMMFRPTISKDGDYVFHRNQGTLLDWAEELDIFELARGDWRDLENLPVTPGERLRESSDKAEDPTTKSGPVGDFCRAYDVVEAIEKFLPDTYIPVDAPSAKPRYTYAKGTTSNGAEVQDGGLFLYSHHGSDPCADMLVNAFDLVRIHKFHEADDKLGAEELAETPMAKLPSFKAMMEFIQEDEGYRAQVVRSKFDVAAMSADFTDDMAEDITVDEDHEALTPEERAEAASAAHARELAGRGSGIGQPPITDLSDSEEDEINDLVGRTVERTADGKPVSVVKKAQRKRRPPPPKDWIGDLELTMQGEIISNSPNLAQIILNDMRLRNSIEFNDFVGRMVSREPIHTKMPFIPNYRVDDVVNGEPLQDHHLFAVRMMLEAPNGPGKPGYGIRTVTDRDLKAAVETAARLSAFNPVREYFEAQVWDGKLRVETMFIRYMGCPDTPYYRQIARLFLLGAVARIFEPGHKFDYVPILCGGQGKRKSTWISILAKNWFGELKVDFSDDKKLVEAMMGKMMMELPELSSMGRSEVEDAKAFVSGTESFVRLSYGTLPRLFKRTCVFIGSTNDDEYLIDRTGNRRWWPVNVEIEMIDTDKMALEVDQLWAEAVHYYREMRAIQPHGTLPLTLTPEAIKEAVGLQEAARVQTETDSYVEALAPWLNRMIEPEGHDDFDHAYGAPKASHRKMVTVHQAWTEGLGMGNKTTTADSRAVGKALRTLGWVPGKTRWVEGTSVKVFVPTNALVQRWAMQDAAKQDPDDLI